MSDRVSLGGVLTSLITAAVIAGAGATVGVTLLTHRANANDEKVEAIDARQRAIERNQAVLVRESQWTSAAIGKLLESRGIAAPPALPRTPVE